MHLPAKVTSGNIGAMAGYHHGNLREAILAAAAATIASDGVGALSLRSIAKDLGVSHTAFRRHFGSREGVLNALAVQGNQVLAQELTAAAADGDFVEVGVAYVRFAVAHPGHFTVMFRSDLLDNADPDLVAARSSAYAPLASGVAGKRLDDPEAGQVLGWGVVHGIATLALTGNLRTTSDLESLTRRALRLSYRTAPE
jgi:AcrR family transcriptional regulator